MDKEAQEKIAIRLHSTERSLLRVVNEVSPCNCMWEELAEEWQEHYKQNARWFLSDMLQLGYRKLPKDKPTLGECSDCPYMTTIKQKQEWLLTPMERRVIGQAYVSDPEKMREEVAKAQSKKLVEWLEGWCEHTTNPLQRRYLCKACREKYLLIRWRLRGK